MSTPPLPADPELLKKLVLGQLPSAQAEKLAVECADDSRVVEMAESLDGQNDTVMNLLPNQETVVDPDDERLVQRLQARLKAAISVPEVEATAANAAGVTQSPGPVSAPAPAAPLPARLEYYQPLGVLGQGGMGTVYLALDTRLGREVALKTLRSDHAANPQAKERFLREARAAAKLSHDHLVPIFYVGESDGIPFLAMPLLKGEPLDALLKRSNGPLPIEQTVRIAREAAAGLAAAHDAGLIHRDIKPSNLWLEAPSGRVKVLDFGLAKASATSSDAQDDTHLTTCGTIVGTPAYMSPEQARGQTLDGRADLFSLGCVLYEALTGQRPFAGLDTMSILMSLASHTPAAPHTLNLACPERLSRLVMQLLEKNPADRFTSAQAFIDALDHVGRTADTDNTTVLPANESSIKSVPPSVPKPPLQTAPLPAQPRSRRVALVLGGALVMLLAFVIFRVQTDQGTLIIQIEDPAVQALLEKDGLVIRDKDSNRTWTITTAEKKPLPSGKYQVEGQPNVHLVVTDDTGTELTAESFSLKRKKEVRVTVTLEAPAAVAAKDTVPAATMPAVGADPDRLAAEYVLSIGGHINFNGISSAIGTVGALPRGPFELTGVTLDGNTKVTDAGLSSFAGCRNLTSLNLYDTPISDAGLAYFKDCKKLTSLRLNGEEISDLGLAYFKDCRDITLLHLYGQQMSNAGMASFKDCRNLKELNLAWTQVSDAGLAHFANCADLTNLVVFECPVTDSGFAHFKNCKQLTDISLFSRVSTSAGLAHFSECKNLKHLALAGMPHLGDAGMAHFKACTNLTVLDLSNAGISDAGLGHFRNCKHLTSINLGDNSISNVGLDYLTKSTHLTHLYIERTKVTEAGVKKFAAALPRCRIQWDGGVIEPRSKVPSPPPPTELLADRALPFVRLSPTGELRGEYRFANEAFAVLQGDETLEVHGNGPFKLGQVVRNGQALRIRAGAGYHPCFLPTMEIADVGLNVWFQVDDAPLEIEGCDFVGVVAEAFFLFVGKGDRWSFTGCRLILPHGHTGNVISFTGQELIVRDSLVSCESQYTGMGFGPKVRLEFENNVFIGKVAMIGLEAGTQSISLRSNIFYGGSPLHFWSQPDKSTTCNVTAHDNLFVVLGPLLIVHGKGEPQQGLQLKGSGNQVVQFNPGGFWMGEAATAKLDAVAKDCETWNAYWGQPDFLAPAKPATFAWDFFSRTDVADAFRQFQEEVTSARKRHPTLKDVGPEITRLGAGAAYDDMVKARAAEPVEHRPAALEGGPVVILRDAKPVAGYVSLSQAIEKLKDGDTIEVRSDGTFPYVEMQSPPGRFTLRAAAGYRPKSEGLFLTQGGDWTIEGLHFQRQGQRHSLACSARRVANCTFRKHLPDCTIHLWPVEGNKDPVEFVDCYAEDTLVVDGPRVRISNSILAGVIMQTSQEAKVEIAHSCLWSHPKPTRQWIARIGIEPGQKLQVHASDCLIDTDYAFQVRDMSWHGERNLLRIQGPYWCTTFLNEQLTHLTSFPEWQKSFGSDADSQTDDSVLVRPEMWQKQ